MLTLTYADQSDAILKEIVRAAELQKPGYGLAFVLSVDKVAGTPHVAQDPASEG